MALFSQRTKRNPYFVITSNASEVRGMRIFRITFVLLAILVLGAFTAPSSLSPAAALQNYTLLKEKIDFSRNHYHGLYETAAEDSLKSEILGSTEGLLTHMLVDSLLPYWEGTRWSFGGYTARPRHGSIACGYFVTTILRDAGFDIDRIRAGQMGAINLIHKLVDEKNVARNYRMSTQQLSQYVLNKGEGVYLLGLDEHIGFVVYKNGEMNFVHSSKLQPACVKTEPLLKSRSVSGSKYKIVGAITQDEALLRKWLAGEQIRI